jgi:hypothetical protein
MIGTKEPGKDNFMTMKAFGEMTIHITTTSDNPDILNVDIACETKKEVMHMRTAKDETIDQFTSRVRSMLRALSNAEPRVQPGEPVTKEDKKKVKTWEEQKNAMKAKEIPA